jgi:ATPase subunit of ABC transporter with duplicated ATPase domains
VDDKLKTIESFKALPSDYTEAPLHLIDFEGQNFKLNREALNLIRMIEDEIIVVSIVGKARTGKSYLMNLLLDNIGKNKGVKFI